MVKNWVMNSDLEKQESHSWHH